MIILKKILIYLLSFILIIFIIPAFLTKRTTPTSSKKETERQLQDNNQQEQTTENQTEISNKNTYNLRLIYDINYSQKFMIIFGKLKEYFLISKKLKLIIDF